MSAELDVRDTYYYALRNGKSGVEPDDIVLGVVRSPAYGISKYVDENHPELAPPRKLLRDLKLEATHPDFEDLSDAESHNRALERLDFDRRYREHLRQSERAQARMDQIRQWASEWTVWLVCFENTEKKRCHRTTLREIIEGEEVCDKTAGGRRE